MGKPLTHKFSRAPEDYIGTRALRCAKCGAIMMDHEPGSSRGEFIHPSLETMGFANKVTRCKFAGMMFSYEAPAPHEYVLQNKDGVWVKVTRPIWNHGKTGYKGGRSGGGFPRGIQRVTSKAYRRARNRGAKLAKKLTRRARAA